MKSIYWIGIAGIVLSSQVFGGEILSNFRVGRKDQKALPEIAQRFEIHRRLSGNEFEVYVPSDRIGELMALAPSAELLEFDSRAQIVLALRESAPPGTRGYHTFKEVQAIMAAYAVGAPTIATIQRYGTSTKGEPLSLLRIGPAVTTRDLQTIMITAATHGDELITVEVVLGIIDRIVSGYGKEARITDLVNNHELIFIPVVNPDGFKNQDRYDNGRDPNRSFPWPQNPSNNPTGSIGPLMKVAADKGVDASIDFHAFGEMIMYPWAYTYEAPASADETVFRSLGHKMAAFNDYAVGQISQIIYIAQGSSADYFYWKFGSVSYGIEMATSKVPSVSSIPSILRDNLDSTLAFIEHF